MSNACMGDAEDGQGFSETCCHASLWYTMTAPDLRLPATKPQLAAQSLCPPVHYVSTSLSDRQAATGR